LLADRSLKVGVLCPGLPSGAQGWCSVTGPAVGESLVEQVDVRAVIAQCLWKASIQPSGRCTEERFCGIEFTRSMP
jgi:hypothetical protein